jgi:hypothetical protein
MDYSIEELKNQIIALDFSKINEIKDLNIESLINYIDIEIVNAENLIKNELIKLGNKNISKLNDIYYIEEPIKLNPFIENLNLHQILLSRIKVDLLKI